MYPLIKRIVYFGFLLDFHKLRTLKTKVFFFLIFITIEYSTNEIISEKETVEYFKEINVSIQHSLEKMGNNVGGRDKYFRKANMSLLTKGFLSAYKIDEFKINKTFSISDLANPNKGTKRKRTKTNNESESVTDNQEDSGNSTEVSGIEVRDERWYKNVIRNYIANLNSYPKWLNASEFIFNKLMKNTKLHQLQKILSDIHDPYYPLGMLLHYKQDDNNDKNTNQENEKTQKDDQKGTKFVQVPNNGCLCIPLINVPESILTYYELMEKFQNQTFTRPKFNDCGLFDTISILKNFQVKSVTNNILVCVMDLNKTMFHTKLLKSVLKKLYSNLGNQEFDIDIKHLSSTNHKILHLLKTWSSYFLNLIKFASENYSDDGSNNSDDIESDLCANDDTKPFFEGIKKGCISMFKSGLGYYDKGRGTTAKNYNKEKLKEFGINIFKTYLSKINDYALFVNAETRFSYNPFTSESNEEDNVQKARKRPRLNKTRWGDDEKNIHLHKMFFKTVDGIPLSGLQQSIESFATFIGMQYVTSSLLSIMNDVEFGYFLKKEFYFDCSNGENIQSPILILFDILGDVTPLTETMARNMRIPCYVYHTIFQNMFLICKELKFFDDPKTLFQSYCEDLSKMNDGNPPEHVNITNIKRCLYKIINVLLHHMNFQKELTSIHYNNRSNMGKTRKEVYKPWNHGFHLNFLSKEMIKTFFQGRAIDNKECASLCDDFIQEMNDVSHGIGTANLSTLTLVDKDQLKESAQFIINYQRHTQDSYLYKDTQSNKTFVTATTASGQSMKIKTINLEKSPSQNNNERTNQPSIGENNNEFDFTPDATYQKDDESDMHNQTKGTISNQNNDENSTTRKSLGDGDSDDDESSDSDDEKDKTNKETGSLDNDNSQKEKNKSTDKSNKKFVFTFFHQDYLKSNEVLYPCNFCQRGAHVCAKRSTQGLLAKKQSKSKKIYYFCYKHFQEKFPGKIEKYGTIDGNTQLAPEDVFEDALHKK